jgi:hypothetical protein
VEAVLNRVGTTDEWGELQILMPEFGEFDPSPSALQMVSQDRALHGPEGVNAAVLPRAIQRLEPRGAELSSGRREVERRVPSRVYDLALARPEVPAELFGLV